MAIWTNLVRGLQSNTGFAVQPTAGITIKPFDIRPFLDEPSSGRGVSTGRTSSGSRSNDTDDDKNPYRGKVRTGVYSQYLSMNNNIDATIQNYSKKYNEALYEAGKNSSNMDMDMVKKEFQQAISMLHQQKQGLMVAMNNELLQHNLMMSGYGKAKEKYDDGYAIRSDVGMLESAESMFYDNPFIVARRPNDNKPSLISYKDYMNIQDLNSFIDPQSMTPNQFEETGAMSTEKEMYDEVNKALSSAGYLELIKGMESTELQANLLNKVDKISTNEPNLMRTIDTMYEKLSNEAKIRLLNNTIRTGVMMFDKEKDKVVPAISGQDAIMLMEAEKIKMQKIDEQLLEETDPAKIAALNAEKEKHKKEGIKMAENIVMTAKWNINNIATNKAFGMEKLGLTGSPEGNVGQEVTLADGQVIKIAETNPLINALLTAKPNDQNVYAESLAGVGMKSYTSQRTGQSYLKSFSLTADVKSEIARLDFGVDSHIKLRDENARLSDLPEFIMANGVFVNSNSFGNRENIKVIGIGDNAYLLPKYYNPTDGKEYSTNIYRRQGKGIVLQGYTEYRLQGDANTKVPVVDAKFNVEMMSLRDVAKHPDAQKTYKINRDDWTFTILSPMPNEYYGSKNLLAIGAIMNMDVNADSDIADYEFQIQRQEAKRIEFEKRIPAGQSGSYANGKTYIGTPEQVYEQIRKEAFSGKRNYDESERIFLNIKNTFLSNIPDENMKKEYEKYIEDKIKAEEDKKRQEYLDRAKALQYQPF